MPSNGFINFLFGAANDRIKRFRSPAMALSLTLALDSARRRMFFALSSAACVFNGPEIRRKVAHVHRNAGPGGEGEALRARILIARVVRSRLF